jgi:predicted O-methyltransferase YrrM
VEAEALYGIIRSRRPGRIIEIGAGHTTLLISEAIQAEGHEGHYTCIEPFRPEYLSNLPAQVTTFKDTLLQDVPLGMFRDLNSGDVLFIDSSHASKYRSDVVFKYSTILPVLKSGVVIHIHDIFLPYEYPIRWIREARYFWNEQYVVHANARQWQQV